MLEETKIEKKSKFLYYHIKPDGEIFYVGRGTKDRMLDLRQDTGRSKHWINTINKYGKQNIVVKIIAENLTTSESKLLEVEHIAKIGRKDLGLGTLVNKTNGGEDGDWWDFYENKEEHKQQSRKNLQKRWNDPDQRRVLEAQIKEATSDKDLHSQRIKEGLQNFKDSLTKEELEAWHKSHITEYTEERRKIHGEHLKRRWKEDPEQMVRQQQAGKSQETIDKVVKNLVEYSRLPSTRIEKSKKVKGVKNPKARSLILLKDLNVLEYGFLKEAVDELVNVYKLNKWRVEDFLTNRFVGKEFKGFIIG